MKLIKLHFCYLFSKFNVITIIIILSLYLGGLLINVYSIPKSLSSELAKEMYFYNVASVLKIIIVMLIVFLFSYSGMINNERYRLCLISEREERIKYYFTKILSLSIVVVFLISIFFILFVLCGLVCTTWYRIEMRHFEFFGSLGFISLMHGCLVYNLVKSLNSILVMFVPCLIMVLEEAFVKLPVMKYLTFIFPIIEIDYNINLSYGIIHVIILISCQLMIGLIKSYIEDIK